MGIKRTNNLLALVVAVFICASCNSNSNEAEVSYEELASAFAKNKETDLCYWYYDGLESNRNKEYYYFIYNCAPSKDYNGSSVIVKERLKVRKSEIIVTGTRGGEVKIGNIKKIMHE